MRVLAALGFTGPDVYLAELITAVEMAWADGEIQANERAMLYAYGDDLTQRLNDEVGTPVFSRARTRELIDLLCRRRLTSAERRAALFALKTWGGREMAARMISWAEAIAAVDGSPVWHERERAWLAALQRTASTAT